MSLLSLQDAINHLYQTAVVAESRTSTLRLQVLAQYCVQELESRGIGDAQTEVTIPGGGREKQWDVAWKLHDKYRLAISLKSILRNLGGTVPNRIDDMIGEVANLQMYSPEVVIGYLMIFNKSKDRMSSKHASTWGDLLKSRLENLSGRRSPFWSIGMIESSVVVEVDFTEGPRLITDESVLHHMFDTLASEVMSRNPALTLDRGDNE